MSKPLHKVEKKTQLQEAHPLGLLLDLQFNNQLG